MLKLQLMPLPLFVALVIIIIIAVTLLFFIFSKARPTVSSCYLPSGFSCLNYSISRGGVLTVDILQETPSAINVTAIGCATNSSFKNITAISPAIKMQINADHVFSVTCYTNSTPVTLSLGQSLSATLALYYTDLNGFPHVSIGNIVVVANK